MAAGYQSFVAGTETVVAVEELAAGSYFVDSLGFVAGTEVVVAVEQPVVDSFDFALGYIVDVAAVIVELDHCTLIVDFVDPLQVRMPTSCVSVHIGYMLQRYT